MNTASHSQIGQYGKPYLGGNTLPKDEYKFCKTLKHNINGTNYCKPDDCYYTTKEWLNMPWMKKGRTVYPKDNSEFNTYNKISSESRQYNNLNYSPYTPFQFDPTWNEFNSTKNFPNACHSHHVHRFI